MTLPAAVAASIRDGEHGTALAVVPQTGGRTSRSWASADGIRQDAAGDPVRVLTFDLLCC
ncbi:hypothetical protein E4P41_15035 [Geodermatophilus sp. DF01-2]|uniref:hypothetical protein n=1 Tax=Geodermatophilus sp. DF01-2 TaxID=2559610 RepID=UPI001074272E|nr:hypothetical protein [Geodermatophilus sp. DF01_2]TFV57014.1 hypothetical protein E4P41_15035 [Geodermatophilus sp. DF01_2]